MAEDRYNLNVYDFKGTFAKLRIVEGSKIIEEKRYFWSRKKQKYINISEIEADVEWLVRMYEEGTKRNEILLKLDTPVHKGIGEIYMIRNKNNNKKYIGLTIGGVSERFKQHCKANSYLGSAIRKYGEEAFEISVIDTADTYLDLALKEQKWIDKYQSFGKGGYNLTTGGELGFVKGT